MNVLLSSFSGERIAAVIDDDVDEVALQQSLSQQPNAQIKIFSL